MFSICSAISKNNRLNLIRFMTTSTAEQVVSKKKPKFTANLEPETKRLVEEEELRYRKHAGRRQVGCVTLPPKLEQSAVKIIEKYNSEEFRDLMYQMYVFAHFRRLPPEPSEIKERAKEFRFQIDMREGKIANLDLPEEDIEEIKEKRHRKVLKKLRQVFHYGKAVEYDSDFKAAAYMGARLAPNYAALYKVFKEIQADDPSFQPKTLFDFASGVGTTTWAANEVWPKSITEYFCVDISSHMNNLARLLTQDAEEDKASYFNGLFFRQFLPPSSRIKYDLVVSAYSLSELPDLRNRIQTIENLWNKTQDMLVLIEHGTPAGFAAVLEARNLILQSTGHKVTETFHVDLSDKQMTEQTTEPESHVLAPCPHELPCPRQFGGGPRKCNVLVNYMPLNYGQHPMIAKELLSYVVLRRGTAPQEYYKTWPRIVQPVRKKKKFCICRMCCTDGQIHEVTFTKMQHGIDMYSFAKVSKWGDLLPGEVWERPDDYSYKYKDRVNVTEGEEEEKR